MFNETNPYNPFKMEIDLQVNVIDDDKFFKLKDAMRQ